MIVPSIPLVLSLISVVTATVPAAAIRRQVKNATPAEALAAGTQVNKAVSEVIVLIVNQAAAAVSAISSASAASVARTATTSIVSSSTSSSIANSTSSTSSAATPSFTCVSPPALDINSTSSGAYLPSILSAIDSAPPCAAVCQIAREAITACVNGFSTNLQLAQCSCQTSFIQKFAACGLCEDSYLGKSTYGYGNATRFCQQCATQSFQPQNSSCGANPDMSFCGLNPPSAPSNCTAGSGAPFPGADCAPCSSGTYSSNSTCVGCVNQQQFSLANSTSCINCNSTLGVSTCQTSGTAAGAAQTCTDDYKLNILNPPYYLCQPRCAPGSGVNTTMNTCDLCAAGTSSNSNGVCVPCGFMYFSLGNSTQCTQCPFNFRGQQTYECTASTGAPLACKANFAVTGTVGNYACTACADGTTSTGGGIANQCKCKLKRFHSAEKRNAY